MPDWLVLLPLPAIPRKPSVSAAGFSVLLICFHEAPVTVPGAAMGHSPPPSDIFCCFVVWRFVHFPSLRDQRVLTASRNPFLFWPKPQRSRRRYRVGSFARPREHGGADCRKAGAAAPPGNAGLLRQQVNCSADKSFAKADLKICTCALFVALYCCRPLRVAWRPRKVFVSLAVVLVNDASRASRQVLPNHRLHA